MSFGNRHCRSDTDFVVRQQTLSFGNRLCRSASIPAVTASLVLDRPEHWAGVGDLVPQESIKMATLTSRFQNAFRDILRQLANGELDGDGVDRIVLRLEQLCVHVLRLCDVALMDNRIEHLITNTITLLRNYNDQNNQAVSFQSVERLSSEPGRPSFNISSEQLQYLLYYDLSVPDIAVALGVSKSTIFRRMRMFGLSAKQRKTVISEEELDRTIREIQVDFPNAGYRRVSSQLLSRSIKVSQMAVRSAMHRIDPEGVAMRWLQLVPRRSYSVAGPLSLWHIDGNHKLIR